MAVEVAHGCCSPRKELKIQLLPSLILVPRHPETVSLKYPCPSKNKLRGLPIPGMVPKMAIFFSFMSSDYFFTKLLLKTAFLLTKCIIYPKTRLWLSRLFYSAFQLKVNRMLCLIFPIFLHLQSCHTVSSLIAQG